MDNRITQFLFNRSGIPNFKKFLDLSAFRQKLISGNIANASTPGYKSKDINFVEEYKRLTQKGRHIAGMITEPGHIPLGNYPQKPPKVNAVKVQEDDLNSVDIDKEVPRMAQNEILYSVGATLLKQKFETLKKVIRSK